MRRTTKVHGPYPHGRKWRLVIRAPDGTQHFEAFDSQAEAQAAKRAVERALVSDDVWTRAAKLAEAAEEARREAELASGPGLTALELVERFVVHLRHDRGAKYSTAVTAEFKLRSLLGPALEHSARGLTATTAAELYARRREQVAVATHRGELAHVKALWQWARRQRLVVTDPWAEVQPAGKPRRGKEQLRTQEARVLFAHCLDVARGEDSERGDRALGVLCALVLGLRASEVVGVHVRDFDGEEIVIGESKTEAGERRVRVAEPLRALLCAKAEAVRATHGPTGRLFPRRRRWVLEATKRLCREAGVPEVSAHSLRGLHATLATEAGATSELVAAQLGHAGTAVTERHYTAPVAVAGAAQARVLTLLQGGRP